MIVDSSSEARELVLRYLVFYCYGDTAKALSSSSSDDGMLSPVRSQILTLVVDGNIKLAIELMKQITGDLLDDEGLHFRMLAQQFVEIVREKREDDAINFARDILAKYIPAEEQKVEDLLSLLAYSPPEEGPEGSMMNPKHRETLAAECNSVILKKFGHYGNNVLESLVRQYETIRKQLKAIGLGEEYSEFLNS